MLPTSEAIVENLRKIVDEMASKIAERYIAERVGQGPLDPADVIMRGRIEHHARKVILDWFLAIDD